MFISGAIARRVTAIAGALAVVLMMAWGFAAYKNGVALERDFRAANRNELPASAARALAGASQVILSSLEPWANSDIKTGSRSHKILGQVELSGPGAAKAIAAFQSAVGSQVHCSGFFWKECSAGGAELCFNPRHQLSVMANGQKFDFLLCYQCHRMEILQNGRLIGALIVTGSPKVLNGLLTAAKIPLAKSAPQAEASPS